MPNTLAIGPHTETDLADLKAAAQTVHISSAAEIAELHGKDQITAVAFKGHHPFGAAEMDALPGLGLIANYGVGYDAIDVKAAGARGIKVTNTPDVLNDDVADLTVAMMIMQSREMEHASAWARSGDWAAKGEYRLNRKMSGGKVGIVGLGRIGREIADRLVAFKMDVHYFARSEKETPGWTYHSDPVSLAKAVDWLVVALVGGPDTQKFVSADVINALGPDGVIANISRGSTIDEAALLDALEAGKIRGAALDVFEGEPNIDKRFYDLPNVVLQPHQGSGTVQTRAAMAKLQRDNIIAFHAKDELLTPVN